MRDIWLIVLALAALAGGFALQKFDLLAPESAQLTLQSDCNLRKHACEVRVPGAGSVVVNILPRDFAALAHLQVQLDSALDLPLAEAKIQFEGLNMDMGQNIVNLQADAGRQGLFTAQAMLPACTAEKMFWMFHLFLYLPEKTVDIQFPVEI